MVASDVFKALGDPIRLEIVERLSSGAPYTISTVSSGLDITRQGVRKHLQVLESADVITLVRKGRDTSILLDRATLQKSEAFIAELERRWDSRLNALREYVDSNDSKAT